MAWAGSMPVMETVMRAGEKVIILGDFNAHVGLLNERLNRNGEMLDDFVNDMNLENLNVTLAEGCVTWSARDQESAIDYVLVNGKMRVLLQFYIWKVLVVFVCKRMIQSVRSSNTAVHRFL